MKLYFVGKSLIMALNKLKNNNKWFPFETMNSESKSRLDIYIYHDTVENPITESNDIPRNTISSIDNAKRAYNQSKGI